MELIGLIGSRTLPYKYFNLVYKVSMSVLSSGRGICSGGALGSDLYTLQSILFSGRKACRNSKIFLPWVSVSSAPVDCRPYLYKFYDMDGSILFGSGSSGDRRNIIIKSIFHRSKLLVDACSGLVAFIYGKSSGSWHTVNLAIKKGIPVFVFCIDGEMKNFSGGKWKKIGRENIFSYSYSLKGVKR